MILRFMALLCLTWSALIRSQIPCMSLMNVGHFPKLDILDDAFPVAFSKPARRGTFSSDFQHVVSI